MSNMNELKRLENDLKSSEDLRKKMDEAIRRIAAEGKAQNDGEIMVAAAKELGYDISIAALEQAKAESEAMDQEELQAVAGGVKNYWEGSCDDNNFLCIISYRGTVEDEYGHDACCVTGWHCLTVTMHTDSNDKDAACWSDFQCFLAYKHEK